MNNITAIDRRVALQGAAAAGALGVIGLANAGGASAAAGGTVAAAPAPAAVPAVTYPVLRIGATGSAVRDLQSKLSGAGFWLGSVDGSFGHLTQQAVYAIQKYHRISRDGICGPMTWGKVNLRRRPVARSTSYSHIEIEKSRQLCYVVSGGRMQFCFNTSTGSNKPFYAWGKWYNGQTPSGTFKCFRYVPGWYTNALGALYRPVFFNGGIALHGSNSIPPYPASHGCCRLSTRAQDLILGRGDLGIGRTVVVY